MISPNKIFKCVLIGDGGVGKTSLIHRLRTGEFTKKYVATIGVDCSAIDFKTNRGYNITFNMWDCAGQEKFGGLREGYCLAAACAIVMFDVTSRISYENVDDYIKTINRVAGPFTPIAVVGNKVDIREGRKVKPSAEYIQYSVKSCYNFERPFLELARQLCKDPDLYFIAYDEQEEKY